MKVEHITSENRIISIHKDFKQQFFRILQLFQKKSVMQFLHHKEIDKQRWDSCIRSSPNGLIYAPSFYLGNLCPGWHALADENYEWVLPITHNTKCAISYLYHPPFTQQLGVFAKGY
jgi:hypothetical protein